MDVNEKILRILEKNADLTMEQIATMLDIDVSEVVARVDKLKADGILLKKTTLINWEKTNRDIVSAIIELRVTPQRGEGFDKVAERIYQYPEVESVFLVSGGFDLGLIMHGTTMKEIALFVAEKLAPMENVISTATHFVLKKYKDAGVIFDMNNEDERSVITL